MPYAPVTLPYRGISVDSAYAALPAGFTSQAMNVVPYDAYKGKLRLGQRRALLGAYQFNTSPSAATREVQVILRADAYVSGTLKQRCIVVAKGEVYIIDDGGSATHCGRGVLAAMKSTGHIGAAVFGQYCYFADGTYYRKLDITASTPTVVDWTHSNGPNNYVGSGSDRATLLVRFGGRLAMSGVKGAPNNWFLCHINDPDDWNPNTSSAHDAVAGVSSTRFGVPGEPIVALVPVGESGLLFAGRHTMTYLTADPVVTDARLIELSRSVGIVSERAWCASDAQTIYMMAQDGLYRVQPNEFQVTKSGRITSGRLDTFFQQQQFDALNCVLGYDAEAQNVYCFMSRLDLPANSVHLLYSQATDSFWPIKTGWPSFHAPTCCGEFPFGDARAPILALGSDDGYLGWFDRDLTSGVDGQAATGYKAVGLTVDNTEAAAQRIESTLTLGPVLQPSLGQVMMKDVRVELTMDELVEEDAFNDPIPRLSGPFLTVLSGQTAEEAIGENVTAVEVSASTDYPPVTVDGGIANYNRLTYSEDFSNGAWAKTSIGTGQNPVVVANNALSPIGTMTASTVTFNSGNGSGTGHFSLISQGTLSLPGAEYVGSVYLRGTVGGEKLWIRCGASNGYVITLTTSWQRFSHAEDPVVSTPATRIFNFGTRHGSGSSSVATVEVWGGQMNAGTTPNEYQKTTSSPFFATYDCGVHNQAWSTATDKSLDLFYESEIAGVYRTSDTLITDPTSRAYTKGLLKVFNIGGAPPSTDWYIRHVSGTADNLYQRDTTLPGTSADTPGGTYRYKSFEVAASFPLPSDITAPRYTISSATYDNTNQNQLGTLLPGRNDAFRCRIRDQAAYVQIESLGVPWAIERMAVLIEPYGHTKNVKGTY